MNHLEATNIIRERMREDRDFSNAMTATVKRGGYTDMIEWAKENEEMALAIADQIADLDSQIANMEGRLAEGDLT